jgi:trk system potassium uptake protein TrkH
VERILVVAHLLGSLLMLFSMLYSVPIVWSLHAADGMVGAFIGSFAGCLGAGLAIWGATRRYRRELQPRDGALLVVLVWFVLSLAAAPPIMAARPDLSLIEAVFEAVSAITTTGATVISGLESLPQSVNVWRHLLQWLGGMGLIVLAVAVLPLLGVGGMQLFKAETPGPMKEGKLTPRITQTAKYLWLIYLSLTLACFVALRLAGMNPFEALCHAFSTVGNGGFSTRDASVGAFDSVAIEMVIAVFMIICAINFASHFLMLRERSLRVYLRDIETGPMLALIASSVLGLAGFLYLNGIYVSAGEALRHAFFNTVSVATSAGFSSQDYSAWPIFAPVWMLFLACIASSAGSTGGGIKMVRALILVKQAARELGRVAHPRAVLLLTLKGSRVENQVIFAVLSFMLLWAGTHIVLTFALLLSGLDFGSAFPLVVASVNNLGPALGEFGPAGSYASLDDLQTLLLGLAMIAGRLELMTFFVVLMPAFWRR